MVKQLIRPFRILNECSERYSLQLKLCRDLTDILDEADSRSKSRIETETLNQSSDVSVLIAVLLIDRTEFGTFLLKCLVRPVFCLDRCLKGGCIASCLPCKVTILLAQQIAFGTRPLRSREFIPLLVEFGHLRLERVEVF